MKIVYIIGPYSGENQPENILAAEATAKALWTLGIPCICPHMNTRLFDDVATYETFLHGYLEIMKRCDIVLAIPGWDKSRGARTEHALALQVGMPVVYNYRGVEYAINNFDQAKADAVGMIPLGKPLESRIT